MLEIERLDLAGRAMKQAAVQRPMLLSVAREQLVGHASATLLDSLEEMATSLAKIPLTALVQPSATFFWQGVFRLVTAAWTGKLDPTRQINDLRVLALDAYFDLLPDGHETRLDESYANRVLMPNLGIALFPARTQTLMRKNAEQLECRGTGGTHLVHLSSPPTGYRARQRRLATPSKPHLLADSEPNLLDPQYCERVDSGMDEEQLDSFAQDVAAALRAIGLASPSLHQKVEAGVQWYVAVKTDDPRIHKSFSVFNLSWTVFVSRLGVFDDGPPPFLKLAEAIVHEYCHNELFLHQESAELFDAAEGLYYSPWRDDARPLNGLFHGAFVFTAVAGLLTRLLEVPEYRRHFGYVEQNLYKVTSQVRVALDQVPISRLTEDGKEVLEAMKADISRLTRRRSRVTNHLDVQLRDHADKWMAAYPQLAPHLSAVSLPN